MIFKYQSLIGIPFTGIGKRDCYALTQDFYAENFSIQLENFARPHDWESDKLDLFRLLHDRAGFDMITEWKVKDLHPGDVLAMAILESNANHLAVYLGELGEGTDEILHHLYGRMSRAEPLGFWRNHVSFVLRHRDVPDLRPVHPDVDIMELLRARNASTAE